MPYPPPLSNIELKARCGNLDTALLAVQSLSPTDAGIQHQIDTYFPSPKGRLKLREIVGVRAELIWYERSNEPRSRRSEYRLTPVSHPKELIASLTAAMGVRGQVEKHRHVLLWHNVRIHLDQVESLGTFVEFEAVMSPGEDEATGHARLKQLCEIMKISPADYLETSYADLMGLD
jgi:adenylate cyclase, class 2